MRVEIFATVALLAASPGFAADLPAELRSPDGRILVRLSADGGSLNYTVQRGGETVISPSQLRLRLAEGDLTAIEPGKLERRSVDRVQKLTATKAAEARDRGSEVVRTGRPSWGSAVVIQWADGA
jgi:hypothetical protein